MKLTEIEKKILEKENFINVKLSLINNNLYCDLDVNSVKREISVRFGHKKIYILRIEKTPYNEKEERILENNTMLDYLSEKEMFEVEILVKENIGGIKIEDKS